MFTVISNRTSRMLPSKAAVSEAWGFILMGLGLILIIALYTYDVGDVTPLLQAKVAGVKNLAGPMGALVAYWLLHKFGIIAAIWPVAMISWGIFVTTGFVVWPRIHRFVGLVLITVALACFAELQFGSVGIPRPDFGYGGHIGVVLSKPLLRQLGHAGSLIALGGILFASLVLTGNVALRNTAYLFESIYYFVYRANRKVFGWLFKPRRRAVRSHRLESTHARSVSHSAEAETVRPSSGAEPTVVKRVAERQSKELAKVEDGGDEAEFTGANVEDQLDLYTQRQSHSRPDPKVFQRSQVVAAPKFDFKKAATFLTSNLHQFKVEGKVTNITVGPIVTTFEFEPSAGTKVSKISSLSEDLARLLSAKSLRILAPIPGKTTVGFEIPNAERSTIGFRDLISHREFSSSKYTMPIAMGVDIFGKPVFEDLAQMPHLLVAGSTGSGKSVFMNSLIASLVCRYSAKDLRLIMVDPKMVEMAAYNNLPHMACPVVTDPTEDAKLKLAALVTEMDDRYTRMKAIGARNIDSFNSTIRKHRRHEFKNYDGRWQTMPYIVLIIDELADMMMVLGKDAETPITRLAQKARASGIHLVIATQRPSAEVVTGLIKANFPTRVAFRVLSGIDSRTILDQSGAESLLGQGDMLFLSARGLSRLHGAYLSEKEVNDMVRVIRRPK